MKTLPPKRISQQTIAQAAGVAAPVVSVVLSGQPTTVGVSEATRQRVLQTAEQLGYKPRHAMRTKTRTVVWLGDTHTSANTNGNWLTQAWTMYFQRLMNSVVNTLEQYNYVLTIKPWNNPNRILDWLVDSAADGVIWFASPQAEQQHLTTIARKIPVVVINQVVKASVDLVDVDQEENIFLAANHLWQQGHRRIAYYGFSNPLILRRLMSYKIFMAEHDQPLCQEFLALPDEPNVDPFTKASMLLDTWSAMGSDRPTALILGDIFALPLLQEAQRRGINVPAELSVVGIDNYSAGEISHPALTSVEQPLNELGRTAVETLLRRIEDPTRPTHKTNIHPSLIVRGSVANIAK